ncbi:MAG: polymerase, sigma-24 subunit, subfamily [Verrucomicrobiales bacterium]|nr:polymerase, sigma-24 subunit, subfamily [Verrucomicrobiales bacterium]
MRELLDKCSPDLEWEKLRPVLDAAMHELKVHDRDAILLRFFENQPLANIGDKLGVSEDTARKRVERAVEKLRGLLARRGITTAAGALSLTLSANAIQVAPAGLATTLISASLAGGATTTTTATLFKLLTMTTLQKTLIATALVAAVGTSFYESHQASQSREQLQQLQQQQAPLLKQVQQLQQERDEATNRLAVAYQQNDRLSAGKLPSELLSLRGEVRRLQQAKQNASNVNSGAIAGILSNPSQNELDRLNLQDKLKSKFAPFVQRMNLSKDDTEKLYSAITENETKKKELMASIVRGDIEPAAALEARDTARQQMDAQIKALLGDAGSAEYDQFRRSLTIDTSIDSLNRELGTLALNQDQMEKVKMLLSAKPEILLDDLDLFRSQAELDAIYQQYVERGHTELQQVANVLTPEQLAAATTIQSNYLKQIKVRLDLGRTIVQDAYRAAGR